MIEIKAGIGLLDHFRFQGDLNPVIFGFDHFPIFIGSLSNSWALKKFVELTR